MTSARILRHYVARRFLAAILGTFALCSVLVLLMTLNVPGALTSDTPFVPPVLVMLLKTVLIVALLTSTAAPVVALRSELLVFCTVSCVPVVAVSGPAPVRAMARPFEVNTSRSLKLR